MTITTGTVHTDLGINSVSTEVGGGGIYNVGDAGVVVSGNQVAAFDDDGPLFSGTDFADGDGLGLGDIKAYHVHDNGDGTFNIYYQERDADPLPTTVTNWVVTFDLSGSMVGDATQITSGAFSTTNTKMLTYATDLPDGSIFMLGTTNAIVDADGGIVAELDPLGGVTDGAAVQQHPVDVAVTGDHIFYTWTESTAGSGGGVFGYRREQGAAGQRGGRTVSDQRRDLFGVRPARIGAVRNAVGWPCGCGLDRWRHPARRR